jgi:phospholipid/cholesterol/gamma-HCH transport system ATP-binding protein
VIELKNISKSFAGRQILYDISFTFHPGKCNLILGESGSGKTVLTKLMVGLYEPDAGQVLYDGRDFLHMAFQERKVIRQEIGMLFQGGALFDSQTVAENVMFPMTMFTSMTKKEMLDRANFCLSRVNLEGKNHLYPSEISGGMKKRVAIARAIALNPRYLFCDEPNSGLDPRTSLVIDNLIKEITEEYQITTIVITHDMNSVMEIGDNILFIYKGHKAWEGTRKEILDTDNEQVVDLVYASKFMKELRKKGAT